MFDLARSEVCSRSTSFLREVVCADRVPAENLWMNSFSCAIFFSRMRIAGFHARADLGLRQHHLVIRAGIGNDALVIDVRGVRADFVQEMAIVGNHEQAAGVGEQVL